MSMLSGFAEGNTVILLPKDYEEEQITDLQRAIDDECGHKVRFNRAGSILDFCIKRGRGCLNICLGYDVSSSRLVWCETSWYANRGYRIISIEEALRDYPNKTGNNLTEEDFDKALEAG